MSYIDKIEALLKDINPGDSKFVLAVGKESIRIRDKNWEHTFETKGFYEEYLECRISRKWSKENKGYYIDSNTTTEDMSARVVVDMRVLFTKVSPAKEPRRTKIFKSFIQVLRQNRGKIDFMNSIFDISEYYYNVTQTESINSKNNDAHRMNIYKLLCLMEKRYGKAETNSN